MQCGGVAVWGSCAKRELLCGGVAVWLSWNVGELECGRVAMWGNCNAGEWRCGRVAVWGSLGKGELQCMSCSEGELQFVAVLCGQCGGLRYGVAVVGGTATCGRCDV